MANDLALSLGMLTLKEYERIENLLKKFDLIFHYKILDLQKFYERLFLDKKARIRQSNSFCLKALERLRLPLISLKKRS